MFLFGGSPDIDKLKADRNTNGLIKALRYKQIKSNPDANAPQKFKMPDANQYQNELRMSKLRRSAPMLQQHWEKLAMYVL